MSIEINMPELLHQYTSGQQVVNVNGSTVGECLNHLIERFPTIRQGLFDEQDKLHSYFDIYVNGRSAYPEELAKQVEDGSKLHIVLLALGG